MMHIKKNVLTFQSTMIYTNHVNKNFVYIALGIFKFIIDTQRLL